MKALGFATLFPQRLRANARPPSAVFFYYHGHTERGANMRESPESTGRNHRKLAKCLHDIVVDLLYRSESPSHCIVGLCGANRPDPQVTSLVQQPQMIRSQKFPRNFCLHTLLPSFQ